jgi:hypothetical protein
MVSAWKPGQIAKIKKTGFLISSQFLLFLIRAFNTKKTNTDKNT